MKLLQLIIFSMFFSSLSLAQLRPSYAFEDSLGNTNIVYRNGDTYLLNVEEKTDIKIFDNYSHTNSLGESSGYYHYGVRFWDRNPSSYITLYTSWSPIGDTDLIKHYKYGGVFRSVGNYLNKIFISQQNGSIVYVSAKYYNYWYYSSDSGYTWQQKDPGFTLISVSSFDNNKILGIESSSKYMVLSLDNGDTYNPVLERTLNYRSEYLNFFYDRDSLTIYFYEWDYYNSTWDLIRSSDGGYSWEKIYSVSNNCRMCIDESNSGIVYLSSENDIYISRNYGVTYELYKTLVEPPTFLYKKPGSDHLYAGTDHYIFLVLSDTIMIVKDDVTSIKNFAAPTIPSGMILKQNYPNPFNSTTTIEFYIDHESPVSLNIYEINGNFITNLFDEIKSPGVHTYQLDASNLSSGIYFYVLKNGDKNLTKRLLLIK